MAARLMDNLVRQIAAYSHSGIFIECKLDSRNGLGPESRVLKSIYSILKYNFKDLVSYFTLTINLKILYNIIE
jgi:hypothetical protein